MCNKEYVFCLFCLLIYYALSWSTTDTLDNGFFRFDNDLLEDFLVLSL